MYRRRGGIVGYVGGWEGKQRVVRLERRILYTCDTDEISHRRFKHDGSSFRRVRCWRKRRKRPSEVTEGGCRAAERLEAGGKAGKRTGGGGEERGGEERAPEGYEGC